MYKKCVQTIASVVFTLIKALQTNIIYNLKLYDGNRRTTVEERIL